MDALFVFATILAASAVLSSPVPPQTDLETTYPVDNLFEEWKKYFPEVKIRRPMMPFNFSDPFPDIDDKEFFEGFPEMRAPLWPKGLSDDFFKNVRDKFPQEPKNDTVENVKEVDGHIVHEKERTYSNGDPNHQIYIKTKTVIVRPKNEDKVNKNYGIENRSPTLNPRPIPAEGRPNSYDVPSDVNSENNPDKDVEFVSRRVRQHPMEEIREGISNHVDDENPIVDLSRDTRINDFYKGTMNPNAVIFDVTPKLTRENPNAPIKEMYSNHLDESYQPDIVSLEHDIDVNEKTPHLAKEQDAEMIDTNAIRKKRRNKYAYYT